jgi:O-antigen/teichoic acid export membrane protein
MKNVLAKGTLYLMVAQFTIMFSGYLIHIGLARLMGPTAYGNFGVLIALMAITKTLFVTGVNRGVSKFVAENKERAGVVLKAGVKLQSVLIVVCVTLYLLFSGKIAGIFNEPSLKNLILFSSLIILPHGFYGIYSKGYLNGIRNFKKQAYIEAGHSFFRLIIAFLLVSLGFGLFGAVFAYFLAPLFALIVTLFFVRKIPAVGTFKIMDLMKFALPATAYHLIIGFTVDLGLLSVKSLLLDSSLTGIYTAASVLAKITISIFLALTFTMLPSISSAIASRNDKLVKKYINKAMRYTMLLLFPFTVLISVFSEQIINLLYSSRYAAAAPILKYLVFGFGFISLYMILCSVLMGAGKPKQVVFFSSLMFVLIFLLNLWLIPKYSLFGAVIATCLTGLIGLMLISSYVYFKYKALVNFVSFLKISAASVLMYFLGSFLKVEGLVFIIFAGLLGILYFLILYLVKEINEEDFNLVKSILKKS